MIIVLGYGWFVVFLVVDFPKFVVSAVGVDKARLVEAVAAHHAADGVGDKFLDGIGQEQRFQLFFAFVAAVAVVGVAGKGDFGKGDIWC